MFKSLTTKVRPRAGHDSEVNAAYGNRIVRSKMVIAKNKFSVSAVALTE